MCGFAGFFSGDAAGQCLERMGQAIAHRGPDGVGYWQDSACSFGVAHRRLAIVDLSPAGAQPMLSTCDRYVLAFNGEIYNHLALREVLASRQQAPKWRGHSDTETLLACFVAWGIEKTLQATVGMFAIALWDRHSRSLMLARDRAGEKPLYWGWQNDTLLFGSELKTLKAHPAFKPVVNREALALLLRYNYIPAPHSIYEGISKLTPGHFVTFDYNAPLRSPVSTAYWDMDTCIESGLQSPFMGNDEEAITELEQKMSDSIAGQMLADVPLGAFLSGGVDSSTIVALMQRQTDRPVKTFTIGFDEPGFNEAEHAKAVALHLKTEHTELYVGAAEALAVIPRLPATYCEPFADSSQIPTFLVSQMASKHVTVALSGDAGDELFGGYNPYQFAPPLWGKIKILPLVLRQLVVRAATGLPLPSKFHKLAEVFDASTQENFYRALISHWQRPESVVIGSSPLRQTAHPSWALPKSFEERMMAMDAQTYMVDDILVKVDRAAMANSLETRVPLLDHRIVEFAWQLPLEMKIRNGKGKWILREVLYRHVPKVMIERPKKGFSVPLGRWLRGPLREWAESLLQPQRLKEEGYFDASQVHRVWADHISGKRDRSRQLWSILMFQAWLEEQRV